MAIDTPARIAVLGAGPMGLEAALYARFLGYDVDVYEQGDIADNIRRWGHVRMFSPFGMNASALGLAALAAQDTTYTPPDSNALLSGREYANHYLLPLSQTDLLSEHVHSYTRVVAVSRQGLLKDHPIGPEARQESTFALLLEEAGRERLATADVVIDASGTYLTPRWLGAGGMPALGERGLGEAIHYHLPDVLGRDRDEFVGRRTLVVGHGYSAATTVVALSQLAQESPSTEVIWITRHRDSPPLTVIENDSLSARAQLTTTANALAVDAHSPVRHLANHQVRRLAVTASGDIEVETDGPAAETLRVDKVVAQVGYRPDNDIVAELQVHRCYAAEGPIKLAASLLGQTSRDCLAPVAQDVQTLVTTEPRYFVLGSKSYGRNSHFLIATGREQIRLVFSFLAGRKDLNLYANMQRLLP